MFPTPLNTQLSDYYFFDFGALLFCVALMVAMLYFQSVSEDWQITILKKIHNSNQIEIEQNKELDEKLNTILSIIQSKK